MSEPQQREWTDLELYVLQEHIEDFNDGLIGRRELLRRVTLMTGSLALTLSVLPALGCNIDRPASQASPTASAAPSPTALATAASTSFALPPAAKTTDGITVKPDDPRVEAARVEVRGPDGAALIGYQARPRAGGRASGLLVVHENRGLTEHIKDVVRRAATAGFATLAIDLMSREGGAERIEPGAYSARLASRAADAMIADLRAALDHLRAQPFVNSDALGTTGFCFGGGMVWNLVASGAPLRAAVPYYGPAPQNVAALGTTKTAVFAVYAEQDTRITQSKDQIEPELRRSGTPYRITVYPGVGHAFHNETGDRFDAVQAQQAWIATVEWLRRHVTS